jgi:hypothetical protein
LEADDADGTTAPDPVLAAEGGAAVDDLEADLDDGLGAADNGVLDFDKGKHGAPFVMYCAHDLARCYR